MRTSCPLCEKMNRIKYPDSFYYNKASYKCNCGVNESATDLDNHSALMNLMEKLSKIKNDAKLCEEYMDSING